MEQRINQLIDDLIAKYGTSDPFRLCELLEIIVIKQPMSLEIRGAYKYFSRNQIIAINSNLSPLEQLKTCAHELGHSRLHTKINTVYLQLCTYHKTDIYEIEANTFSDLLLLRFLEHNQENLY